MHAVHVAPLANDQQIFARSELTPHLTLMEVLLKTAIDHCLKPSKKNITVLLCGSKMIIVVERHFTEMILKYHLLLDSKVYKPKRDL